MPLEMVPSPAAAPTERLEVVLPGGARLCVPAQFDPAVLAQVIADWRVLDDSGPGAHLRGHGGGRHAMAYQAHTARRRHAIVLEEGPRLQPLGQVPRVARFLALAHHFERLLAEGIVRTQGELAALAGVTRPRVTQILNLLLLAPDIQEELLFLPRVRQGRSPITEHALRHVVATPVWREQRARWAEIRDAQR